MAQFLRAFARAQVVEPEDPNHSDPSYSPRSDIFAHMQRLTIVEIQRNSGPSSEVRSAIIGFLTAYPNIRLDLLFYDGHFMQDLQNIKEEYPRQLSIWSTSQYSAEANGFVPFPRTAWEHNYAWPKEPWI
jgi:hypothetical protein